MRVSNSAISNPIAIAFLLLSISHCSRVSVAVKLHRQIYPVIVMEKLASGDLYDRLFEGAKYIKEFTTYIEFRFEFFRR